MLKPVDLVSGKRILQPSQRIQQPVRQEVDKLMLQLVEKGVILGRAFIHPAETNTFQKTPLRN